jgi:hypothetical protein
MDIHESTKQYEAWLRIQIPLLRKDLNSKHKEMRHDVFSFLRATFYRWAQSFPAGLTRAPEVLGVGDLHVENFGTWRDAEGRLVWGINDFDEACFVPFTNDLVRLAASALIAADAGHLKAGGATLCAPILAGYLDGLNAGGRPFVLAENHPALRQMAVERLKHPEKFWKKLDEQPPFEGKIPSGALKGLRRALPEDDLELRLSHRTSGLGSLGRRRFCAVAQWRGARIAREAKELVVSAWSWAKGRADDERIRSKELLTSAVRCPDPFATVKGRWGLRRLAPDCSRIELTDLPSDHDAERLLHAMGFETANVHLGSVPAKVLMADLRRRHRDWLAEGALVMAKSTLRDWKAWTRPPLRPPGSAAREDKV